jgi:hypothetical protein
MSAWLCFCACHLGLLSVTLWELIFLSTVLLYFTVQRYFFSSDFKISEITDQENPRRCSHPIIRRFRASLEMLPCEELFQHHLERPLVFEAPDETKTSFRNKRPVNSSQLFSHNHLDHSLYEICQRRKGES